MTDQEKRRRRYCKQIKRTLKSVFKCLSVLMLPLLLGVFTVVITVYQQTVAREQRLEDLQLARQQRLEDRNESRLQRDQDWDIAVLQRETENKANRDRYQDEVLVDYIKEISSLLQEKNGSLTLDPLVAVLVRLKTLNAIRQLDGTRQIHIIRFLYEAGQLNNANQSTPLDISTAELTNIDFQKATWLSKNKGISLVGTVLQNCTFNDVRIHDIDFSSATLDNVTFVPASLENVNFFSAKLFNVKFSSSSLSNVDLSGAAFSRVDLLSAQLWTVNISSASLYNVDLSHAALNNVLLSFVELSGVNFSFVVFKEVNLFSAHCIYGTVSFHRAKMAQTIFDNCHFAAADFTYADLSSSSFRDAVLTKGNFSFANLCEADFTNSKITDDQLHSALSIQNTKLPNGTLGQDKSLIENGDAHCDIRVDKYWHVQHGRIAVIASEEDQNDCQFVLQSSVDGATMSQRISLIHRWDATVWTDSHIEFHAQMSNGILIELSGRDINGTVINKHITTSAETNTTMKLHSDMEEIEIVVRYDGHNNQNNNKNIWCDNMELFVYYKR